MSGRPPANQPVTKTCPVCEKPFRCTKSYDVLKRVCCSKECHLARLHASQVVKRTKKKCETCGKVMLVLPCHMDSKRFCSKECLAAGRSTMFKGGDNPAWVGGTGTYWKRMARERDEYTCRKCGKKFEGKELHAHHLIPHASGGTHDLDNLVSLCNVDHRFVEHKFWAVLKAELGTARFTALLEKARVEVLSKLRSV